MQMQEHQQQSAADVSLVFQMLKREDKLREEVKVAKAVGGEAEG